MIADAVRAAGKEWFQSYDMRIPFDLIAAALCLGGISKLLLPNHGVAPWPTAPLSSALAAWGAFLLVTWLLHELVTRDAEWRTRFGMHVSGLSGTRHPLIVHTWGVRVAQGLSVACYAAVLWFFQWPAWVDHWPAALGLDPKATVGGLSLARSSVVTIPLNLLPFLLAMVLAWVPRWRLAKRMRGQDIPLGSFLSYEARLTWLPLAIAPVLVVLKDIGDILPPSYTSWMNKPGVDLVIILSFLALTSLVIVPKLIIWLWQCRPLPDGELRRRLMALMQRSGVSARDIMVWGPRGSGLLNACVLGGWARFRYVLISPALVDELGLEETEAVLAHELGHARYGHLIFLFMMILCLCMLLDPVMSAMPQSWQDSPLIEIGVIMAVVCAYLYLFYGTIMRQHEREADLASAELMGTPQPIMSALERLARITGNIRNVWCWHHGSIADRVAAVERLSHDPEASLRFHRFLRRVRILFIVATVAALAAQMYMRLNYP